MSQELELSWRKLFDESAHTQETDYGISRWSPRGLQLRKDLFLKVFRREAATPKRVLDVGCGSGTYCADIVEDGHHVFGIDYSAATLFKAKDRLIGTGVKLSGGDIYQLPYRDSFFDVVLCAGVLQYLTDEAAGIQEMGRVLRVGGILYIITRNALFPGNRRTDREGNMRSFSPYLLRRAARNVGFVGGTIYPVFIPRGRARFFGPILNGIHKVNTVSYPFLFLAEAFLIVLEKRVTDPIQT